MTQHLADGRWADSTDGTLYHTACGRLGHQRTSQRAERGHVSGVQAGDGGRAVSDQTIRLRTWGQPEFKTCHHCGRVGSRSFYEALDGWECFHIDACIARQRRATNTQEHAEKKREAGQ